MTHDDLGPVRRLGHVPALDGIRGIAILLVLFFHAYGRPSGGFYGVDLFFVLSGFLITTLLLEERDKTGHVNLRHFYARRVRRLMPALAALLIAYGIIYRERGLPAIVVAALYLTNVVRSLGSSQTMAGPLGHLWSLAEEEQFYLLWPGLLLALASAKSHWLRGFLVAATAAALVVRIAMLGLGVAGYKLYFAPITHADPILLGCLLAVIRREGVTVRRGWIALPLVAAPVVATTIYSPLALGVGMVSVEIGAGILILSAMNSGPIAQTLSFRPLVWVGTISYSLYIWQQLIRAEIPNPALAVVASIAAASASYWFVESPFRRRRPGWMIATYAYAHLSRPIAARRSSVV